MAELSGPQASPFPAPLFMVMRDEIRAAGASLVIEQRKDVEMYTCVAPSFRETKACTRCFLMDFF